MFDRELIEAELALNLIASADMPRIAWDALEAGLDGPGIRRLAALEKPTFFEVNDVLAPAMSEMGLRTLTTGQAALRIAKRRVSEILTRGEDPIAHLKELQALWIRAGYPREIRSAGQLYDRVFGGWYGGQSDEEIRKSVTQALAELVQSA